MTGDSRYLILGAAGQDGRIALQKLSARGIEVHAGVRSHPSVEHAMHRVLPESRVHLLDVTDRESIVAIIRRVKPTRILNLAGQSNVHLSWDQPASTFDSNTVGALNVLQAVRDLGLVDRVRLYQALSSEIFGRPETSPQDETTTMHPVTPYGLSKASARSLSVMFRERFDVWVSNGILYNHESMYRPESYVVRHVSASVARIKAGLQDALEIGDMTARRDWGYAPDYVDGMMQMLEHDVPDDFVLATGASHSVRDLVEIAFAAAEIDDWEQYLRIRPERIRSVEPAMLVGDARKAREAFDWSPSCSFDEMVAKLVEHDLNRT